MSGIAEVLINLGYRISGSDLKETETTRRLRSLGADINPRHDARYAQGAGVLVVSSAIRRDNPEVAAAKKRKIPILARAEMLA